MSNKVFDSHTLADFLMANTEKADMISTVFRFFRLDCLERSYIDPDRLDELVRAFNETDECDKELLVQIIDAIKVGRQKAVFRENDLIECICNYISDHRAEDLSIEAIAKNLNISYHYMCHVFKSRMGCSVNAYRTQKRLETAMKKLIETDEKIADIAVVSGFNNISYFTETFTKTVGEAPSAFRTRNKGLCLHSFYDYHDILLAAQMPSVRFLAETVQELAPQMQTVTLTEPDERFGYLHEAAIMEYHGVLYASWYHCRRYELQGYTPICGKRSFDGGKTWTELEILCEDKNEKILYCPPVYGICEDRLYMLVNQMVAADHMHALDLYVLNNESGKFEFVWSRPIPFKLNTNVITLPNGKLMLPGRIAEPDGFPNTPAVLISDSGKIDAPWRLVKIAENGDLPDGMKLVHPEITAFCVDDVLYMFCRNDQRRVPIVYISGDCGEHWSEATGHDVPFISSKMYAGDLSDGRSYLTASIDEQDRSRLAVYFTEPGSKRFSKKMILFDKRTTDMKDVTGCHYPCAAEYDGKLFILATKHYAWAQRGAILYILNLNEI